MTALVRICRRTGLLAAAFLLTASGLTSSAVAATTVSSPAVSPATSSRLDVSARLSVDARYRAGRVTIDVQHRTSRKRWSTVVSRGASGRTRHVRIRVRTAQVKRWPATIRLRVRVHGRAQVLATSGPRNVQHTPQARPPASPSPDVAVPALPASVAPIPPPPTPTPAPQTETETETPGAYSGTLPKLAIDVRDGEPITTKDPYRDTRLTLTTVDGNMAYDSVDGEPADEIKGRGNTTWDMPKKPYRLKLSKKAPLLGMPSSRHWALLADWADPSLLRNELILALGTRSALAWTPRTRAVEVVMNGAYAGVYHLTEHVRVDDERIDIEVGEPGEPAEASGYLLERDFRLASEPEVDCTEDGLGLLSPGFETSPAVSGVSNPFALKEPECYGPEQFDYIKGYVEALEAALYGAGFTDPAVGYRKYVDIDSMIDYLLIQEFAQNTDAWFSSVFAYKPSAPSKLMMGPLWDFDRALGNYAWGWEPETGPATPGVYLRGRGWPGRMLQDPWFRDAAAQRWQALRTEALDLLPLLAQRSTDYAEAALQEHRRWPRGTTFAGEVQDLHRWIADRIAWMDQQFPEPTPS